MEVFSFLWSFFSNNASKLLYHSRLIWPIIVVTHQFYAAALFGHCKNSRFDKAGASCAFGKSLHPGLVPGVPCIAHTLKNSARGGVPFFSLPRVCADLPSCSGVTC